MKEAPSRIWRVERRSPPAPNATRPCSHHLPRLVTRRTATLKFGRRRGGRVKGHYPPFRPTTSLSNGNVFPAAIALRIAAAGQSNSAVAPLFSPPRERVPMTLPVTALITGE